MKNKIGFWMLFWAGVFLIRLMFTAAFWYFIGYLALGAAAVFFLYVVFIRWFLVNLNGDK